MLGDWGRRKCTKRGGLTAERAIHAGKRKCEHVLRSPDRRRWIVSPANACVQISLCGATVEGKATFGFVSKYQKGASTPTGSTEFQYHAGGFEFSSTDYQWLVVAGARAQYKGRGSVKGKAGVYGFLLSAIDGELQGGAKPDRFRIKIWVISSDPALDGQIVYDNGTGADDITSDAQLTALAGGSISIKSK